MYDIVGEKLPSEGSGSGPFAVDRGEVPNVAALNLATSRLVAQEYILPLESEFNYHMGAPTIDKEYLQEEFDTASERIRDGKGAIVTIPLAQLEREAEALEEQAARGEPIEQASHVPSWRMDEPDRSPLSVDPKRSRRPFFRRR